ncbi:MAG: hypothetical protein MJB14_02205 [Spirochaetes bacterium]|nr:hypothetical protein [Spirochaetota bacterium]
MSKAVKIISIAVILSLLAGCYIITKNGGLLKMEWDDDNTYYSDNTITIENQSGKTLYITIKIAESEYTEPDWYSSLKVDTRELGNDSEFTYTISNPSDYVDEYIWVKAENQTLGLLVTGSHVFQLNDGLYVSILD